MKLFGRRKVAGLAASAPLAIGMTRGVPSELPPPTNLGLVGAAEKLAMEPLRRAIVPPGWGDFTRAREQFYNMRQKINRVNDHFMIDLDIESLRSVSRQHKVRMQIAKHQRMQEENQTFLESLARKFSVLEFWKGRESPEYGDDAYPAATAL